MRIHRLLVPLWFTLAAVGCPTEEATDDDSADDTPPVVETCDFTFAILTDTHVGEGELDHGEPGWDDGGGDGGEAAQTLAAAVQQVNDQAREIAFVVVLGDITDSAERSELEAAQQVLAELEVPWLPLLGNHDTWPYAWNATDESWDEAEGPTGDVLFDEVFAPDFERAVTAFPSLVRAPPAWNPEIGAEGHQVNFAFDHCGTRFVALDTNTRVHAPEGYPGIGPEAALHDFEGGMWRWFLSDLTEGPGADAANVVILSHHPVQGVGLYTFDPEDFGQIEADLESHGLGTRISAFFAGHIHIDAELEGPLGLPVILTAAAKDGTPPRLVQVSEEGVLDW